MRRLIAVLGVMVCALALIAGGFMAATQTDNAVAQDTKMLSGK